MLQHSRRLLQVAHRGACTPSFSLSASEAGLRVDLAAAHCITRLRHIFSLTQIPATDTAHLARAELCHKSLRTSQPLAQQHRQLFGLSAEELNKDYKERRLIGYSPKQLYDVVAGVEHYKEFVPWCQRSHILKRDGDTFLEAELEVGFRLFVERYTSQVYMKPGQQVVSKVYDSTLFDHLDSTWDFQVGPSPSSTWLTFSVDFGFKSPLYRSVAAVFFEEVVQRMMAAFEGRCQAVYGASSLQKKPANARQIAKPLSARA